jgi:CDP-diglyceride synthetase
VIPAGAVGLYLESVLERHLGIKDRPVEGEASKLWINIR